MNNIISAPYVATRQTPKLMDTETIPKICEANLLMSRSKYNIGPMSLTLCTFLISKHNFFWIMMYRFLNWLYYSTIFSLQIARTHWNKLTGSLYHKSSQYTMFINVMNNIISAPYASTINWCMWTTSGQGILQMQYILANKVMRISIFWPLVEKFSSTTGCNLVATKELFNCEGFAQPVLEFLQVMCFPRRSQIPFERGFMKISTTEYLKNH